jgi:DNA repair exonuclease SbcCD nuclease subunit
MIFITGDLHGAADFEKLNKINGLEEDVIIIAGDFGVLWEAVPDEMERDLIAKLEGLGPTVLFIDGNHENFDRLDALETRELFGADVGVVSDKIFHLRRGRIYTIDNKTFFAFGGAPSPDKIKRLKNNTYWEREIPNRAEYELAIKNLEGVDFKVDYVLTHDAPAAVKGMVSGYCSLDGSENYLNDFREKIVFKKWYFGHYHQDRVLGDYIALYNDISVLR